MYIFMYNDFNIHQAAVSLRQCRTIIAERCIANHISIKHIIIVLFSNAVKLELTMEIHLFQALR